MSYLVHFNPNHDPKTGRFDYKPGSTILPKGTRVGSVSGKYWDSNTYKNNGRWMYVFREDEEWDKKVYEGAFSVYLAQGRGARWIRRHEYETVADMKMPTRKEREDEFRNLLNDRKYQKTVLKELASMKRQLIAQGIGVDDAQKKRFRNFNPNKIRTEEDYKTAYEIFCHMMENTAMFKTTQEYANRISSKWDAMVDDNNLGVYNKAIDPIIIFRADKFIRDVSDPNSPKYLKWEDIVKNYKDVAEELAKEGRQIAL
jgi:hypothetical protein